MASLRDNRRGILALASSQAAYCLGDVMTKLAAPSLPIGELLAVRGLMTVALMGVAIILLGQTRLVRDAFAIPVAIRSCFEAGASGFYVAALIHMPIANAGAIVMTSPLILTGMSVLFYRERVGWRRWAAIIVGFIGVLFIVKPSPSSFDVWALVCLAAACCGASRDLMTRCVGPGLPTLVIAFVSAIGFTIAGCVVGIGEQWRPIGPEPLIYLVIGSCFFSLAVYLIVLAFRGVDFATVAPFRYTFLLCALLSGFFIFNEWPDALSVAGAGLIVAGGLYAMHRDAVRRRELARVEAAAT